MRIAGIVARLLLGLMFTVFGLNGFLHFLHQPPPTGLALQYLSVMTQSHMMVFVYAVQLVTGLLLLAGIFVPLALTLLGPVIVNILLFHLTLEPKGIGPGLLAAVLWFIVFFSVFESFRPILRIRPSALGVDRY